MELTWLVLLPPAVVIGFALLTHNVIWALLSGVITAALLTCRGNLGCSIQLFYKKFGEETSLFDLWYHTGSYDHAYTLGFLVALGIIIELITHAGGLEAYGKLIRTWIRTKKQAETVPLVLAPFFFLDDYLNNLVGGAIVRPLFDQFHLARAKLAYILNGLSSSQCLIIPASSWLALIVMQLQAAGVGCTPRALITADPYTLYLYTIPYIFYPILSIISTWIVVQGKFSYGPMAREESYAANHTEQSILRTTHHSLSSFFVPLGSFLLGIPAMLLILNGWHPWQFNITFCGAISNTDLLFAALWWASLSSLLISSVFLYIRGILSPRRLLELYKLGAGTMKNSLLLLTLAWMFASFLKYEVPTGAYLAQHVLRHAPQSIIPALCFLTATLITAIAGSSWGMIGIMIPLVLPLVTSLSQTSGALSPELIPLLLPVLGAVLSGAAAGPHISPITDAAIISSATAHITPLHHIRTALPYYLPPLISALFGFIVTPFFAPLSPVGLVGILMGLIALTALLHLLFSVWYKKTA
jgi:tetracycline resistance efflux pump